MRKVIVLPGMAVQVALYPLAPLLNSFFSGLFAQSLNLKSGSRHPEIAHEPPPSGKVTASC